MWFVLASFFCILSGYLIVTVGLGRCVSGAAGMLLRISLAVGFGLGAFSIVFFLTRAFGHVNLAVDDLVLVAVLGVALRFRSRTVTSRVLKNSFGRANATPAAEAVIESKPVIAAVNRCATQDQPRNRVVQHLSRVLQTDGGPVCECHRWIDRALAAAFGVALCIAIYSAVLRAIAHPHGDGWDAFSIWNLHARFLFRGGGHWRDGFSALIPWSHPDYPLLLPAAVAHFWSYLGYDAPMVPAAVGLAFTFSTVGLLFASLVVLRGRRAALLGALVLLSTPFFVEQGTAQYADVPLSFFLLGALALSCLYERDRGSGMLVLAGLAAGFAAWTKNEGLLFLVALAAAQFLESLLRNRRAASVGPANDAGVATNWASFAILVAAMAPALLLIGWFKHSIAPPGDLFSAPNLLHRLAEPRRYWIILQWYVKEFVRFGQWYLVPGTLLLAALPFFLQGKAYQRAEPGFRASIWTVALTASGYFVIYLITPYDLFWHLRFSLNRLFLQLWPCAILLYFVTIPLGTPTDSVSK